MNDNQIGILAELDVFLDARLAVLKSMEPDNWQALFGSWYRERTSDNFERVNTNVSQAAYEALYETRGTDLFQHMDMTPLANQLTHLVLNRAGVLGMPVTTQVIDLDVNFYPYQMSDEDKEFVLSCIGAYTSQVVQLHAVYLSPEEITPAKVKAQWQHVFMYDFDGWVGPHLEALKSTPLPGVNFYIPKLYKSSKTLEEIANSRERLSSISPFDFQVQLMVGVFQLNYVEPELYSAKPT
jgi:hypothetical protein